MMGAPESTRNEIYQPNATDSCSMNIYRHDARQHLPLAATVRARVTPRRVVPPTTPNVRSARAHTRLWIEDARNTWNCCGGTTQQAAMSKTLKVLQANLGKRRMAQHSL